MPSSSHHTNSAKRDAYSPPKLLSADVYATTSKSPTRKQTDYYYNKENELSSKKNDTDATLISPRSGEKLSPGYVAKNFSEKYVSRQRNESFSPIESPIHVSQV